MSLLYWSDFWGSLQYYVVNVSDSEKAEGILSEFKKAVTTKHGEEIMTIAERLERKGKEAGIQIGEQRGVEKGIRNVLLTMLSKNINIDKISEFTGISIEKIKQLNDNKNEEHISKNN